MEDAIDPEALAGRIDSLLGELRGDARAGAVAEQLVQSLMQFYGAAFDRTLELIADVAPPIIETLAADPLVGSVMLLHDLHPADRDRRLTEALDLARALVDDPNVTISVVASDRDRLRIRVAGGERNASATCRNTVLRTLRDALPEIADIDIDDPGAPLSLRRADGSEVSLLPTSPPSSRSLAGRSSIAEDGTGV